MRYVTRRRERMGLAERARQCDAYLVESILSELHRQPTPEAAARLGVEAVRDLGVSVSVEITRL